MVRAGARTRAHMYQEDDQESITSVARIVVNRIRSNASEDRKELKKQLEEDNKKVTEMYQTGFRQGVIAVRYIHDSYVLPKLLGPSFGLGFLACLIGILVGMFLRNW